MLNQTRELSSLCEVLNPVRGQIPRPREGGPTGGLSSSLGMSLFSRFDPCALVPTVPRSSAWFPLLGRSLSQYSSERTPAENHGAESEGPKGREGCSPGLGPLGTNPLVTDYLFAKALSACKRRPLGASITETLVLVRSPARGSQMS